MDLNFELWLFTVKNLGQTYDAAQLIYEHLSEEQKQELKMEYEKYLSGK